MEKLSVKDVITYVLLALGFAVQWGAFTARVDAMEKKIDSVTEIQGELRVIKDIALDSRNRIVRLESKLLRALPERAYSEPRPLPLRPEESQEPELGQ